MPDRHVPLDRVKKILTPLMILAIKKSGKHLAFLLGKLINTHLSFAKRTLSGPFIEKAHRIIEQVCDDKDGGMQMIRMTANKICQLCA